MFKSVLLKKIMFARGNTRAENNLNSWLMHNFFFKYNCVEYLIKINNRMFVVGCINILSILKNNLRNKSGQSWNLART